MSSSLNTINIRSRNFGTFCLVTQRQCVLPKSKPDMFSCVKMASDLGQETKCGKLYLNFMFSIAVRKILNAFPKYYVASLTLDKVRAVAHQYI